MSGARKTSGERGPARASCDDGDASDVDYLSDAGELEKDYRLDCKPEAACMSEGACKTEGASEAGLEASSKGEGSKRAGTGRPKAQGRGPGRPPSKPAPPSIPRVGIVTSPDDVNHRLEFVYNDPMLFKSLFTYFKIIKAREIHIRCSPVGVTFFARDQGKNSRVVASVAGAQLHWYYCAETFWLGLNRDSVEKMFASIDKSLYKITIVQPADDPNNLLFVFKDSEIDKECMYKVPLTVYPHDADLYAAEEVLRPDLVNKLFPIEFRLTDRQFKKTIADAEAYSSNVTIEKIHGAPLQITYAHQNMYYNEVYRSPDKIALRCDVPAGTPFQCMVKVQNIKPLAASMVTESVRILCREDGDILFRSAIDGAVLDVSTLTRIS
jgi:hypothetical protein